MFDNLIRIYVVIGLVMFGMRAVLNDLGMAPWVIMLSLAVAIILLYGAGHLRDAVDWMHKRNRISPARVRVA